MKHNGFTTFTVKILLFINSANICAKKIMYFCRRNAIAVSLKSNEVLFNMT